MAMPTRPSDMQMPPTVGAALIDSLSPSVSGSNSSHAGGRDLIEELRQAKREIELLKSMDPFRAADMAIEIQVEKMRAAEATSARDSAVQRLASAYDSIKEKVQAITRLTSEKAALEVKLSQTEKRATEAEERLKLPVPVVATTGPLQFGSDTLQRFNERENLKREVEGLNVEVMVLKGELERSKAANSDRNGPSQHILANVDVDVISPSPTLILDVGAVQDSAIDAISNDIDRMGIGQRPHSVAAFRASTLSSVSYPSTCSSPALKLPGEGFPPLNDYRASPVPPEPCEMAKARNSVLASLPIPEGVPDDVLTPIMIPAPFTIHEFLGNTTGSLKNTLSGYRTFQDKTTFWCSEREEHGYFLTPLYKCTTSPRASTAHAWTCVDPKSRMNKPTECFFSKEGKWYYAGQYIAIRLEDLTPKEWSALESDTQSVIVKETLIGRKNVSPQNLYETGQLYSAGALEVACVGLQCVGYNIALNRTIMEQAAKCHASGRWKTGWTGSGPPMLSSGTISAPPMITGDVLLGDLISSSNSGITHPHLQKSLPVNTSEFDASAPAAAAAASAAASVLNEGNHTVSQHRVLSMFNSM